MRSLLRCLPFVALAAAALVPAAAQRPTVRPTPALTLTYSSRADYHGAQHGGMVPLDTLLFLGVPGEFQPVTPRVVGTVYVYALRRGAYVLTDSVTAPADLTPGSRFGDGVAASGNTLVIGAPGYNARPASDVSFPSGEVFVYERLASGRYSLVQRLVRPEEAERTVFRFGEEVHVTGDAMIIAGPPTSGTHTRRHGGIYRYVRSGGTWTLDAKLWGDVVGYPSVRYDGELQVTNSFNASFRARLVPGTQAPPSAEYLGGGWYTKSRTFPAGIGESAFYRDVDYDAATGITRVLTENLRHVVGRDVAQPGFSPSIGVAGETPLLSDTTFLWNFVRGAAYVGDYTLLTVPRSPDYDDSTSVVLTFSCPTTPSDARGCRYVGRFEAPTARELRFGVSPLSTLTGTLRGSVLASSLEITPTGAYVVRHYVLRPAFTSTSAEAPPRTAAALRVRVWPSVVASGTPVRVAVEGGGGGACRLSLADALGRETTLPVGGNADAVEVSTSGLASGVYRVRASCAAGASASAALVVRR